MGRAVWSSLTVTRPPSPPPPMIVWKIPGLPLSETPLRKIMHILGDVCRVETLHRFQKGCRISLCPGYVQIKPGRQKSFILLKSSAPGKYEFLKCPPPPPPQVLKAKGLGWEKIKRAAAFWSGRMLVKILSPQKAKLQSVRSYSCNKTILTT